MESGALFHKLPEVDRYTLNYSGTALCDACHDAGRNRRRETAYFLSGRKTGLTLGPVARFAVQWAGTPPPGALGLKGFLVNFLGTLHRVLAFFHLD